MPLFPQPCPAAVEALLKSGANPHLPNKNGSTSVRLTTLTTGRGGGSPKAKACQKAIIEILFAAGADTQSIASLSAST
jgi:hypothetical protein